VTDEHERRTFSRPGTARALVLLGSALAVTAAAGVCFVAIVFGPTLAGRPGLTGAVVLGSVLMFAFVLAGVVLANLLAIRARSLRRVVGAGCGTLFAGVVLGLATLLIVISTAA
jgi:hypothetical protein